MNEKKPKTRSRDALRFPRKTHQAIKKGEMNLCFLSGKKSPVKKGKKYNVKNLGVIRVTDVRKMALTELTDEDAVRAGFKKRDEAASHIQKSSGEADPETIEGYRVEFQYEGPIPGRKKSGDGARRPRKMSPAFLDKLDERLKKLDRRAQGVTYSAILKDVSRRRYNKIIKLADRLGGSFSEMRRKLNKLATERLINVDFNKRYYISARGRKLLEHREAKLEALRK